MENVKEIFYRWATQVDEEVYDVEYTMPYLIDSLEFILEHCSCINVFRDESDIDRPRLEIVFKIGEESLHYGFINHNSFDVYRVEYNEVPNPNGFGYQKVGLILFDIRDILDDLIKHTLKRIPDHKTEKFLMERI